MARNAANNKPQLTVGALKQEAKNFLRAFAREHTELFGITDGKAVGTYVEERFNLYLREGRAGPPFPNSSPYQIASYCAILDKKDETFEWLGKAYEAHDSGLVAIKTDSDFDSLHPIRGLLIFSAA